MQVALFALAGGMLATPVVAQDEDSDVSYISTSSGIDVARDSNFEYLEAEISLNGDNSKPGFVLRGFAGTGHYDYRTDVPGGKVDADAFSGDVMIGYQGFYNANVGWSAFIGADLENNDLTPSDPENPVSGSQWGVKVAAEIETQDPKQIYYDLAGEYTTAYETYWSIARLGYKFAKFYIGPEGQFIGDETYDSQRIGAFVKFDLAITPHLKPEMTISSGYGFVQDKDSRPGDEGGFGGIAGSGNGAYLTVDAGFDF